MAKLKDGFYKLTAQSIGSDLLVLLAGGGSKPISDFALANYYWANVPISAISSTTTSPTFATCFIDSGNIRPALSIKSSFTESNINALSIYFIDSNGIDVGHIDALGPEGLDSYGGLRGISLFNYRAYRNNSTGITTIGISNNNIPYVSCGGGSNPYYEILHGGNYTFYLGYIGTTAVLASSATLNLTGIGSINAAISISAPNTDMARIWGIGHHLEFGGPGYAHKDYYFRPSYSASGSTRTSVYFLNASAADSPTFTTIHGFDSSGNASHTGDLTAARLCIHNNTSNSPSLGISLYGGSGFVESYGITFTGTASYGGLFGDVLTGDWATYFTMDGGSTSQGANVRGWIFRHKTGGNKVSIGADGNIQCTAWYRTIGNGGWYNETHGGGWYMLDSTWLRAYSDKSIYTGGTILIRGAYETYSGTFLRYMQYTNKDVMGFSWDTSYYDYLWFKIPGTNNQSIYMRLALAGGLYIWGNSYAYHFYEHSDIRYKNVLDNINISVQQLAELPLFNFTWTDRDNSLHTGSSALAVQELLPNLVSADGEKLTLDYGVLGTVSGITACRELTKQEVEIQNLKNKIQILEKEIENLKNKN